jgi:hypothetical protein
MSKKMYKIRAKKKRKIEGDKNQIKRRKDNKMLSQKAKKGQGKKLDKRQ